MQDLKSSLRLNMAKKIKLLVAPGCSRCEETRRMLDKNKVRYEIVDITKNPKLLAKYIMAVPGVIINGVLEFYGQVPDEKKLLEKVGVP